MRKSLSIAFMILLLAIPAMAADKMLTAVTNAWEPYAGQDLKDLGFGTLIVSSAFKAAGYSVKPELILWDEAVAKTKAGKYDVLYLAYYNKSRTQDFFYSDFFTESLVVFCKRKETPLKFKSIKDLSPYTIGVVKGYTNTPEFDAAAYLKKVEAASDEENLRKLLKKEVDVIVIDKLVAQYLLKTKFIEGKGTVDFLDPPLIIHPLFCLFPKVIKESEQRVKDFNKGLALIKANGTLNKIIKSANQ